MKYANKFNIAFVALITGFAVTSCNNVSDREKAEERAEAKVGEVYNPEVQGVAQENHANQFYISRGEDMNDEPVAMQGSAAQSPTTGAPAQNKDTIAPNASAKAGDLKTE